MRRINHQPPSEVLSGRDRCIRPCRRASSQAFRFDMKPSLPMAFTSAWHVVPPSRKPQAGRRALPEQRFELVRIKLGRIGQVD